MKDGEQMGMHGNGVTQIIVGLSMWLHIIFKKPTLWFELWGPVHRTANWTWLDWFLDWLYIGPLMRSMSAAGRTTNNAKRGLLLRCNHRVNVQNLGNTTGRRWEKINTGTDGQGECDTVYVTWGKAWCEAKMWERGKIKKRDVRTDIGK